MVLTVICITYLIRIIKQQSGTVLKLIFVAECHNFLAHSCLFNSLREKIRKYLAIANETSSLKKEDVSNLNCKIGYKRHRHNYEKKSNEKTSSLINKK